MMWGRGWEGKWSWDRVAAWECGLNFWHQADGTTGSWECCMFGGKCFPPVLPPWTLFTHSSALISFNASLYKDYILCCFPLIGFHIPFERHVWDVSRSGTFQDLLKQCSVLLDDQHLTLYPMRVVWTIAQQGLKDPRILNFTWEQMLK